VDDCQHTVTISHSTRFTTFEKDFYDSVVYGLRAAANTYSRAASVCISVVVGGPR